MKPPSVKWRLRDEISLNRDENGVVTMFKGGEILVSLPHHSRHVVDAFLLLGDGADERQLLDAAGGDAQDTAVVFNQIDRLKRHGFLVADLWFSEKLLATLLPRSHQFDVGTPGSERHAQHADRKLQLSRFAYLHRVGDDFILECPDAPCAVLVRSPELTAWLYRSTVPTVFKAGSDQAVVMALLAEFGFLVDPGQEESAAQRTWEFHDRLFHRRTRLFDDFQPYGGTYRFFESGQAPAHDALLSPPAVRPGYGGETISLPKPQSRNSGNLRDIMEKRRSKRVMGTPPVTLEQVAELLYRVARIREVRESPVQDCVYRPFPSGGAIHELEFYLAVHQCDGLKPGLYHYRGVEHALTLLAGSETAASEMICECAKAWGQPDQLPQCLIVLSSRLPRLAWKYQAVAYKVSLLNAGVVLQSLYLVCTDLGLNGAAAGSGKPDLFAAATGNSSWEETSIAEFGFGSAKDDDEVLEPRGVSCPPESQF